MVCFTLIIGRLFLSKEDLASWKSPLRGIHYINSLLHPVIYVCFYSNINCSSDSNTTQNFCQIWNGTISQRPRWGRKNMITKFRCKVRFKDSQNSERFSPGFWVFTHHHIPVIFGSIWQRLHLRFAVTAQRSHGEVTHSLPLDFLSNTSSSSGTKRKGWEERGIRNQVAEEHSRC